MASKRVLSPLSFRAGVPRKTPHNTVRGMRRVEFLIIGGGPTGLGAACRLEREGADWLLLEKSDRFGGLASSFRDRQGFTWDLGGHVHFSHYETFDRYLAEAIPPEGWLQHQRESWIWILRRFVPYPFQYNLHRLPPAVRRRCLEGLKAAANHPAMAEPAHFGEWMRRTFGDGLCDLFLEPYNRKVWAYSPERLDWRWIGERVAVPDYRRVLENLRLGRDEVSWGPNRTFLFPKYGGTGSIWQAIARRLPHHRLALHTAVGRVAPSRRQVRTRDGRVFAYRFLISTMPLDRLLAILGDVRPDRPRLLFSSVYVIGVGLDGQPPASLRSKCWMYFPEPSSPYYRVTVFSNYSPYNTARPYEQWSLMAEVSESREKRVDRHGLVGWTLQAMKQDGLLADRDRIRSLVRRRLHHAYPTPFLGRDSVVDPLLRRLEKLGIYSRGRFGAWKYEVGNEDHSFAQGYECADRLLRGGGSECEPTLFTPARVNARRNP